MTTYSEVWFVATYHLLPTDVCDNKPTRRYHSIMLIHDSLDTEAASSSSALANRFNVPPDSCESTVACLWLPFEELNPLSNHM